MLPSGSWLQIVFGFALGITITVFVVNAANLLRNGSTARKYISALLLFSLSMATISFLYGSALSGGLSVQWQFIGFPGNEHATKILDIGYVQTQSGNIYYFTGLDRQDGKWADGNWEQVDKVTGREFVIPSAGNCGAFSFLPVLKDNFIESKAACIADDLWSTAKVVYAIDDFGRVYLWFHDNSKFGGGDLAFGPSFVDFWFRKFERSLFLIGGMVSCILGLSVTLLLVFSRFLMKKVRKHNLIQIP